MTDQIPTTPNPQSEPATCTDQVGQAHEQDLPAETPASPPEAKPPFSPRERAIIEAFFQKYESVFQRLAQ